MKLGLLMSLAALMLVWTQVGAQVPGFAKDPNLPPFPGTTNARMAYPSPSPLVLYPHQRYGNINPFPIDYAFQPRLRGRLTLSRLT